MVAGAPDGYKVSLMNPEDAGTDGHQQDHGAEDFQPIARFTDDPSSVTVRADAPLKTIEEFIAHAKANPGTTISNAGSGTIPHIAAAAFGERCGRDLQPHPLPALAAPATSWACRP